jgi:hypothetical protein
VIYSPFEIAVDKSAKELSDISGKKFGHKRRSGINTEQITNVQVSYDTSNIMAGIRQCLDNVSNKGSSSKKSYPFNSEEDILSQEKFHK